ATSSTWSAGTYRNSASGSMKFLISQGQAIRSVFGRSRVTHFISFLLSSVLCRLSAGQQGALAVLVEAVEQRAREREQLVAVAHHRQPAQEHIEAGCFRRVEALVREVGFVNDLRDLPQHRIMDLVAAQERLEAAV